MIEVAAAIIDDKQGRILIARRSSEKSQAGLWEFPGGKLEENETPEDCLRRELLEEMSITIEPTSFFAQNEHCYGTTCIRLLAYKATYIEGEIKLVDHDEYCWVYREELKDYDFAPADIKFVNQLLIDK
ncbi:8-oxo-dGTP diphosphatase MutT [Paenibacillus paridis]|uniref:8-oxo-dGTP diphosphatase MutT n=1 Tax=Paenibacillus paridis TaxID=2583376 RepID=UPI001120CE56|nr:8-oxo-dGTP diphosphatase MutT [Paenibacillus paridis]